MKHNNLLIAIDGSVKEPNKINQRWPWMYADGELEAEYGFDVVVLNQPQPTEEGYYIAYTEESKAVLIHLVTDESGIMKGRCCYVDDYESLKHINSPEQWH